jgi:hypothetical protein
MSPLSWTRVAALAGAVLLLSGCSVLAREEAPGAAGRCSGVPLSQVRGVQPSYVDRELDRFPADRAVCRALWLPGADQWFVPQGVALQGRTAWVSGYRWRPGYGKRYCRVMRVGLRDGRLLADERRLEWERPDGSVARCRHGGGLALTEHGLWVATAQRLWLLDPARVGRQHPVVRVWHVAEPVSGGLLVTGDDGRLGLGDFRKHGSGPLHWYATDDLVVPGVRTVGGRAREEVDPTVASALRVSRVPIYAQGGAVEPRGERRAPYLVSSLSTCGILHAPSGREVGLAPGAEGIALDRDGGLWAVLESGTRPYQQQGRPLVPMLVRLDVQRLLAGENADCSW